MQNFENLKYPFHLNNLLDAASCIDRPDIAASPLPCVCTEDLLSDRPGANVHEKGYDWEYTSSYIIATGACSHCTSQPH
ncbi:hypothetical protein CEXT_713101 [Caerostris extrusa]|uniref:Uncharacterized protein n=1 Tax=Caerostris extrusa TaxID=172846 RepID=A0AAV4MBL1_CAEEX|nr:hypothetical protein CEXT_713101 [Caerostris extrusa]